MRRSWSAATVGVGVGVGLYLCGGAGGAKEPELALVWSAPVGCPDGQVVREGALALLRAAGAGEGRPGQARIGAEGDVSPRPGGGFTLRLRLRGAGADGERVLVGESCEAVSDTAALLLAIAIDPGVLGGGALTGLGDGASGPGAATQEDRRGDGPREREGPPEVEVSPGLHDKASSSSTPQRGGPPEVEVRPESGIGEGAGQAGATRGELGVGVRARGGVGLGLLDGAAGSVGIGVIVGGRRWLVEVAGASLGPKTVFSAVNPAVGGRFWVGSGGVRACGALRLWQASGGALALDAPLCGLMELGAVSGVGVGSLEARRASAFWAGIGGSTALRLEIGGAWALWLEAEGLGSLSRPRFRTEPSGAFWQVGAVGGRVGLAVEMRWAVKGRGAASRRNIALRRPRVRGDARE